MVTCQGALEAKNVGINIKWIHQIAVNAYMFIWLPRLKDLLIIICPHALQVASNLLVILAHCWSDSLAMGLLPWFGVRGNLRQFRKGKLTML